ncbi:unnamed protein product [Didymodactylos carnosus]|uniref:NACHT domain-containing protein n=1 Tax=Didymodactylos carnosus TaxID=1234261 RepID=A0A815JM15_9BILA|nr:unnamed protein product [Didymodactylos carnosus]CAF4278936.1 unnamed protein product [Didymodactylos carnosus]
MNDFELLFDPIREHYRTTFSRIERLVNRRKNYSIDDAYINLSIVESKELSSKEEKFHSDANYTTFEEIYGTKRPIKIQQLFNDNRKRLLVLGRAGIGKTTFCQYIAYQWASGKLFQQFKCILWIRFRFLNDTRYPKKLNNEDASALKCCNIERENKNAAE